MKVSSRFPAVAGLLAAGMPLLAQQKQPNIILLMTDQHRADALGCTSDGLVISPNLDALASDGYFFSSAYSSTPSSTPARAGLLTGCSPWVHGMLGYGEQAEHYPFEMPSMLRELGYSALAVGKMHFYPQDNTHGYELLLIDESGRHDTPYFESDYRKWLYTKHFGIDPDITGIGWNEHRASEYKLPEELHPTCWTADRAVEMIQGYESEKPLYLKVSFARPHSPYDPPKRFVEMYEGKDIPSPSVGDWVPQDWRTPKDPASDRNAYIGNFGDDYARNSRLHYYANITFVDEQIGRVIAALKEKGMYENSIIFFVADHGDMLGDHHLWRKTYAYEGSAAIPFIVKLPAGMMAVRKAGSRIVEPVELRDVLPTCLDLNGAARPEGMDGMSILPLMTSKKPEWREYIDLEHSRFYWKDNYWTALTDGRWKYIWMCTTGEELLFDLKKDPQELHDLSSDRKSASQLEHMRQAMVEHLSVRGEDWASDGKLVIRKKNLLYSPCFPAPSE